MNEVNQVISTFQIHRGHKGSKLMDRIEETLGEMILELILEDHFTKIRNNEINGL